MLIDNDIVQLEVPVREAHAVQIHDSINNLEERTVDLVSCHLARHDDGKEIVWCVLHDLVPVTSFVNNVQSLDNITVVQR